MAENRLSRITIDAQCDGRPCVRGVRVRVTDILELLSAGASVEEILSDYPYLEREDILASIEHAAHHADRQSQASQSAVNLPSDREKRTRLMRELAKLDPQEERQLAEEALDEAWPE
ncbi:MAG: DUF433 domain-containing protein [Bryobacteraceae bacterium]